MFEPAIKPHWQDHASAIASGFFGDWLEARDNPLAVPMHFRHRGELLDAGQPAPELVKPNLIVLIHGLTELESIWHYPDRPGVDYATEMAADLDATPLSLRYNTGRPIYRNGETLAGALEELVEQWPVEVENLVLIGHSMGGLLIRSACFHGRHQGHQWTHRVSSCVYVGSPHDGSWLARGAHALAETMNRMPRDYLKVVGEFIDLRSEGIRNLSRGEVVAPDVEEPPLLPGAAHYVISGLLAKRETHPINALFGDALVHPSSARGQERSGWALAGVANFPGIHHIRLAHEPQVAAQLKEWLR